MSDLAEWARANPETVRELLDKIGGNGHTIWSPDIFPERLRGFNKTIESDLSEHKSTVYVNGEPVESVEGIWGLPVLETLARHLGRTDHEKFLGRGSAARAATEAIREELNLK